MQTVSHAPDRLAKLSDELVRHGLDGYFLSPEDEHLNEYLPDAKKRIEWLTGFTGESAPLLVTQKRMHLFVDGRFHLQVDDEIDASAVEGHKLGPDTAADSLLKNDLAGFFPGWDGSRALVIGYDPFIFSPQRFRRLQKATEGSSVTWKPVAGNLVDALWPDRTEKVISSIFSVDETLTGKSIAEKLVGIRKRLSELGVSVLPVTRLDEVAWLFNIRGRDILYNPVAEAYAILTADSAQLFIDPAKVPDTVQTSLAQAGIQLRAYEAYAEQLAATLKHLSNGQPAGVLIDTDALTLGTTAIVDAHGRSMPGTSPITEQKALKNATEIAMMARANERASRGIIRHLATVTAGFAAGQRYSEADVRADLEAKYREEPNFFDLSFPTIPGIGTNSAIIHYSHANPEQIGRVGDFYLLDSGCQYDGGTTDTTRTTVFGVPNAEQVDRYTAVLQAHIACASLRFPAGTTGAQIDSVCRAPMWAQGLDFAHGTGHGVGAFLNVHEGPNRISRVCSVVFKPGMVTSIEPGYYLAGWGGIRLENLYTVAEDTQTPGFLGRPWYIFEPLTWVPFERRLIAWERLTAAERAWLSTYYQGILSRIGPTLNADEKTWLEDQCAPAV